MNGAPLRLVPAGYRHGCCRVCHRLASPCLWTTDAVVGVSGGRTGLEGACGAKSNCRMPRRARRTGGNGRANAARLPTKMEGPRCSLQKAASLIRFRACDLLGWEHGCSGRRQGGRAPAAPKAAIDCGETKQVSGPVGTALERAETPDGCCGAFALLPPFKKRNRDQGGPVVGQSPGENKTKFLPAAVCEGVVRGGMRIVRLRILWRAGKNFGLHWHVDRAGPINGPREAGHPGELPDTNQNFKPCPPSVGRVQSGGKRGCVIGLRGRAGRKEKPVKKSLQEIRIFLKCSA